MTLIFTNCSFVSSNNIEPSDQNDRSSSPYGKPKIVGTIRSDEIDESSGLVQSRCNSGIFWTHNDSGDGEFIYAVSEKGERLGTWKVAGAKNNDWEDLATIKDITGKCFLYLGDIGNNNQKKNQLTIYKVPEPQVTDPDKASNKKNPLVTEPAEAIGFSYPDRIYDAETLLVHPVSGDIYVLTKQLNGASQVFRIGDKAENVGSVKVPAVPNGLLTGGEISPDGTRVLICDYLAAYEISLPKGSKKFDDIWTQNPLRVDLGEREQGEAVCYSADGQRIYATSEKKNSPVIRVERR